MTILFDPTFPPKLLDALRLILSLDRRNTITIASFDRSIREEATEDQVVFMLDEAKRGIETQVRLYAESGYRVFAYKIVRGKRHTIPDIAMTVLSLFPRVLEKIRATKAPFVYAIRHKANRLTPIPLKPLRAAESLSALSPKPSPQKQRTSRRKQKPDGTLPLFT